MHEALLLVRIGLTAIFMLGAEIGFAGDCKVNDYGEMPVEMQGVRATTIAKINGQETRFILDTGAFYSIMSRANASALKLSLDRAPFGFHITGIGGDAYVDITHIQDFGILDGSLQNVEFVVGGSDMGMGLIGANLLDVADLDIDLAQGKLHLMKPSNCDDLAMAYWTKDGNYQVADLERSSVSYDRRSFVTVKINGKSVRALLDTGAGATVLSRRAAERAGIDLKSPEARAGHTTSGFGPRNFIKTWIVPIASFSIGTETIQHSQMQVMDGDITNSDDAPDMLLGVDFFLAHHLYIANSQNKIYFTYNGGRVFSLAQAPKRGESGDTSTDESRSESDAPKTAEDYALRGQADLSRGEPAAAITDLDNAIRIAPDKAPYYSARARANLAVKQPDAAMADLKKSIDLDPRNVEDLLLRARLRWNLKDNAGAESDIAAARQLAPAGSQESHRVANSYVAVGQPAAAIPLYDDWIRLHDDDSKLGLVLNDRCWARALADQKLDAALADCKAAIKRDGPQASYLDSLGLVQLRLKNYPTAIDAYGQAVAIRPRAASSQYGLGLANIRGGHVDVGNADLEAAKALDPKIDEWFSQFGI